MVYQVPSHNRTAVIKIVFIYALFGFGWIYGSDTMLGWLVHDPTTIVKIALIKGSLFIFCTATLLYFLINRFAKQSITERKQAEMELLKSAEDLRESQRMAHVGSWRLDIASNHVVWSEELYKMYGFDSKLPVPHYTEHQKLFTPESWERLSAAIQNTKNTGMPYSLELEFTRVDGNSGWMWVYGLAVLDEKGSTVGIRGTAQDITERKRSEKELLEAKEFLELAQRSAGAGLWAWDFASGDLTWSPEQYQMFGLDPAVAVGAPTFDLWRSVVHPDDLKSAESNIHAAIRDRKQLFNEYRIIKHTGEVRWIMRLGK